MSKGEILEQGIKELIESLSAREVGSTLSRKAVVVELKKLLRDAEAEV